MAAVSFKTQPLSGEYYYLSFNMRTSTYPNINYPIPTTSLFSLFNC
ncbi:hypothetical protein [Rubritalea tangerina]